MRRIFLFAIIFHSGNTFYAQEIRTISDFFKNDKGEIKISKANQKKIKPILGSYYYCALDYCLHKEECNVLKTVEFLILECQNKEKKFIKDYEPVNILERRNKDSLVRMNISFDTSEFRKDFHSIQCKLEKFKYKFYHKNKISIYTRQNTFDTTGLKKFLSDIEELKQIEQQINQLGEKASNTNANWLMILDPLEKNRVQLEEKRAQLEKERKLIAQEIWLNFVKSQMRLKWDEKQRNEKQKEDEEQRFINWKENASFSIPYNVKIEIQTLKCSRCNYEKPYVDNVLFPTLNFKKYGNTDYMENLWVEHKKKMENEIENEIEGYRNFFDNLGTVRITDALSSNRECNKCGRRTAYWEKNSISKKKLFEN